MTATPAKLSVLRGLKEAPRSAPRSRMDTMEISQDGVEKWKRPPFQRPLKINAKVRAIAEELKKTGVLEGVLTLGILKGVWYLVDGQHRIEAFKIAAVPTAYCDVRIIEFEDMAEMADEFTKLNDSINKMTPDDRLRAMEQASPGLQLIRERCPFVGYDQLRRSEGGPILSMSLALRCWFGSGPEVPQNSGSVVDVAKALTEDEAAQLCDFLEVVFKAWGRDKEYSRLWGALNLQLVAWLWRRTVVIQYSPKSVRLTKELFQKCAMSLSSEADYIEWLVGKLISEHHRAPAFRRIKAVFSKRLNADAPGSRVHLPAPAWAHS